MVQPQHGREVLARQVRRTFHGDVSIGVGRVTHHQHFDIAVGNCIERPALRREDLGIHSQQFGAFHAGPART